MANTEYLEGLAPKPFTTEDISKVISINLLVYLPEFGNLFECGNCEKTFKCLNAFYKNFISQS